MAHLVVFQPDARVEARLSDALNARHRVSNVRSWAALSTFVVKESVDGCVVDADHPNREEALVHMRRVRRRHPGIALVAYADVEESDMELYRFGGLGVDGVVLAHRPPWAGKIRDAIERSLASARASRVRTTLEGRYPPQAVVAIAWSVEHAGRCRTVAAYAAGLGHTSHSLGRLLRESGLPPPNRLLLWGRLLLAGAFLNRDERTVDEAAFLVGYSTGKALSRAMKREIGRTPSQVARQGGLAFVQGRLFPRGRTHRRRRRTSLGAAVLGAVLSLHAGACATAAPAGGRGGDPEAAAIERVIDASPLDQMHFGVLAVDATDGHVIYARDARRHFVPASNEKLLVTSTALSLLGPDYRYETTVYGTGPTVDHALHGDLVLIGTGDPTLSEPFWASGEAALSALADSIRASGVHRVTGDLIVDASAWDSTTVGPSWEVADLPYAYSSTGGVFAVDRGELHVIAHGGPVAGAPVAASWNPVGTADFVQLDLTTSPADSTPRIRSSYLPESRRVVLHGSMPAGLTDTLAFAMRDPVGQATATLARLLEDRGVVIEGGSRIVWDAGTDVGGGCDAGVLAACPSAHRIGRLVSPPLIEVVAAILGPSQNWMTEQLIRTLGAVCGEAGSWREGSRVVTGFLTDEVGVDSLDIVPWDGSGLSAYNLVTPRALVRILRYMAAAPAADAFRYALAEPGEEDTTLEHRLPDLEGRLFAKTGTISNVNSLSGYLVRDDGRQIVFSILSNGSGLPSSRVRAAIDEVVAVLAGRNP